MDAKSKFLSQVEKLSSATKTEDRVKILEEIGNNLFDLADTDPALEVVKSTNLIHLLAQTFDEDKGLNKNHVWFNRIVASIYQYKNFEIPKEQTSYLLRVMREYFEINDATDSPGKTFWFVVHTATGRALAMEASQLYNTLRRKAISNNEISLRIFQVLCRDSSWQQKVLADKQFVLDLVSSEFTTDTWSLLDVLCIHPDAKTLLPVDKILQKAADSQGYIEQREAVVATLSSEQASAIAKLNLEFVNARVKALDHLLKTQNHPNLVYNYPLPIVILPFANLTIADANKEILGQKLISHLLGVLIIQEDKPLSTQVATDLERSKQEAAKALWNLAFLEANRAIIEKHGGCNTLKSVLQTTANDVLKKNIEGVLFMFSKTDDRPQPASIPQETLQTLPQSSVVESLKVTPTGKHVMISYNWANQPVVIKLSNALKSQGYNVWLDVERMTGSTLEAMAGAIEGADIVLMCVTQKYKDSPNCRLEGEYCIKRNVPFIPLLMQQGYKADGWLGIAMGNKLYYNFYNEVDWDTKISGLVKEIGTLGKSSSLPPAIGYEIATPTSNVWTPEELLEWLRKEEIESLYDTFIKNNIKKSDLMVLKALLNPHPQNALGFIKEMFNTTPIEVLRIIGAVMKL